MLTGQFFSEIVIKDISNNRNKKGRERRREGERREELTARPATTEDRRGQHKDASQA